MGRGKTVTVLFQTHTIIDVVTTPILGLNRLVDIVSIYRKFILRI